MSTEQNYVGRDSHANDSEQSVKQAPSKPLTAATARREMDQPLSERVPYDHAFIDVPFYLVVHDRDDDNEGASQISVLFAALNAYEESIARRKTDGQQELHRFLIEEIRASALEAIYQRLSDSSEILREVKYGHSTRRVNKPSSLE